MFNDLLETDYGMDDSPLDDTHIVQVLLYFSEADADEFKRLCKARMKDVWPRDYIQKGNISDLLLNLLRHGKINLTETPVG